MIPQTNSSLSAARDCLRMYDLGYNEQLEPDGDGPEYFAVGSSWHFAHEAQGLELDPYEAIRQSTPTPLWSVKLQRLFAAQEWYWKDDQYEVVKPEFTFSVTVDGIDLRGQIDGIIKNVDGRLGIKEHKTTSFELDDMLSGKLRLDTQTGIYDLAAAECPEFGGKPPEFILYDVVRKPTIKQKKLTKAERDRMSNELRATGVCTYYGEQFSSGMVCDENDNLTEKETPELYGARLTADIGDRPEFYFARREVPRTDLDRSTLIDDLRSQVGILDSIEQSGNHYSRNPNACYRMGTCRFTGLCENHLHPQGGDPPSGFHRREHRHPELDGKPALFTQPATQ